MWVLKTEANLTLEQKRIIRKAFKKRTGEKCIVLDCGLTAEWIPTEKDKAASD